MALRCYREMTAWAVSFLLLAGCSTASRGPGTGSGDTRAGTAASSTARESKEVDPKLVEAHAHYAQALIYDMNGEESLALEEFSKSALADPGNEELVLDLTRRYLRQKQPEKALEVLRKASAVPGASGAVFASLGMVYSQLGKNDQAIRATQTAIKRAPQSLAGYQNLSIIYLQKNLPKEALKALDQAAKAPETGVEFLIDLGGLYANLLRQAPTLKAPVTANGLAVLDRAAKMNTATPRMTFKLADDYNQLGDRTNASQIYQKLLEKYGEMPVLRNDIQARLAEIYLRDHDLKKAREQLQAMVRDEPANSQAYYLLGTVALEERNLKEAVVYYQRTLLLNDAFEQAYYDLAGAQINLDQPKDALATLEKARARFTRNFLGEFLAGLAYMRQKDFTNAASRFTSAESIARTSEPERLNGYFYFEQGAAYERKGDFELAEQNFQKSLQLSPELSEALNYYGYMLADKGVKLQKAREMIDKAVQMEPKNAAYVDSLGWVLFKLGKSEEGLAQIQKAIELSEEPDATLFEHLGDIHAALKQTDKAQEAWRKSLAIEPNEQIQKKLDQSGQK